jgi:hypothetical protein
MSEIFDELARKCLTGGRGLHLDVFFSLPDGIFPPVPVEKNLGIVAVKSCVL